jgi:hypothetical protein
MSQLFEPFTPLEFRKSTGLNASDNEAIYMRWVNVQINYANLQTLQEISSSLQELRDSSVTRQRVPMYQHVSYKENND